MNNKIIFSLIVALALFAASTITTTTTSIFAQNTSNKYNQTKEGTGAAAMNKTDPIVSGNGTQGAGAALQNQTSKGLSNAAGSIIQGVKNLLQGNGQK